MNRLILLAACSITALVLLAGGCASGTGQGGGAGYAAPLEDATLDASCFDYGYWQDAQDALDIDPELAPALDEDGDAVACNELGQTEYEQAWPEGYAEACQTVFADSPDGYLYLDDTAYEQSECDGTDPGPGDWEPAALADPEADGLRDAWTSACEEFFAGYVVGELYWGDELTVTQDDCDLANAY